MKSPRGCVKPPIPNFLFYNHLVGFSDIDKSIPERNSEAGHVARVRSAAPGNIKLWRTGVMNFRQSDIDKNRTVITDGPSAVSRRRDRYEETRRIRSICFSRSMSGFRQLLQDDLKMSRLNWSFHHQVWDSYRK